MTARAVHEIMRRVDADVWILSATGSMISPGVDYELLLPRGQSRRAELWRVCVWSRLPIIADHLTATPEISACATIRLPDRTPVVVYAVAPYRVGELDRDERSFSFDDLLAHASILGADWCRIRELHPELELCVGGDFDCYLAPDEGDEMLATQGEYYGGQALSGRGIELGRAYADALRRASLTCRTVGVLDPAWRDAPIESDRDHVCLGPSLNRRVLDAFTVPSFTDDADTELRHAVVVELRLR